MSEVLALLFRHAEPLSQPGYLYGPDAPLSSVGEAQVREFVVWGQDQQLSDLVSTLYTSPTRRAMDTAKPAGEAWSIPVMSKYGMRATETPYYSDKPLFLLEEDGFIFNVDRPGNETREACRERTLHAFREIAEEVRGEPFAVVTHSIQIKLVETGLPRSLNAKLRNRQERLLSTQGVLLELDKRGELTHSRLIVPAKTQLAQIRQVA